MKKAIFLVLLLPMLAGCETMAGLGKDIQGLGEKIEESSSN